MEYRITQNSNINPFSLDKIIKIGVQINPFTDLSDSPNIVISENGENKKINIGKTGIYEHCREDGSYFAIEEINFGNLKYIIDIVTLNE